MSLWRQIRHGVRSLANRRAEAQDIDDEARHYLEEMAAGLEAEGMSPAQARRAARIEMGSPIAMREQVREFAWETRVEGVLRDCGLACRRLTRSPSFAGTGIATLALGIGAAAAIFSLIDGVLWRPLPYPASHRLVALVHTAPGINLKTLRMSASLYFTYREESRVFDNIALWNGNRATVTGLGEAEEVPTLFVTHEFLRVLQVQPALGRGFAPADGEESGDRTVLLSDGYWKQRFGGVASTVGRSIVVNGNPHQVIGVMPPGFTFMDEKVSLLVPMRIRRDRVQLIAFAEDGIARLKPGATIEQAGADIARCLTLAPAKFPLNQGFAANAFRDARISPALRFLKDHLVGDIANTLWVLMGAVSVLLLIACANVANLMLVRADGRRRELAVRAALGAGWGRLARELLLESLLLGAAGGAIGLALCVAALRLLTVSPLPQLPRLDTLSVDARTIAFTAITSIAVSLVFGLIPVWKYARLRLLDGALGGGRWAGGATDHRRVRAGLVVLQVALAMLLLVCSGLMIRTFQALRAVDPGFSNPNEVQAVRVSIPEALAREPVRILAIQEAVLRRFEALPGVSSVSITSSLPMEGGSSNPVYAGGHDYGTATLPPVRNMRNVSPGFMTSIGGRMITGRDFTWNEMHNPAAVVILSENMARELWRNPQAALGQRIRSSLNQEWRQVVGVAADLRDDGIQRDAPKIVYWPLVEKTGDGRNQVPRNVDLLIRSPRAGSAAFVTELRQALAAVNPNLPLANVRTLQSVYNKSLARTTFSLVLLSVAGSMALILGVVGIYGVIAYSVSRRTRDIGIRIALGAPTRGVVRMFVREGLLLSSLGAAFGLLAALSVTRLLKSLLYAVSPLDPPTYASVLAGLILAALLASWIPARRAAAVDPVHALRAE